MKVKCLSLFSVCGFIFIFTVIKFLYPKKIRQLAVVQRLSVGGSGHFKSSYTV